MFAASPSPTMEAAFGRLHKGGRAAFGGAPTFVDSIVGDGGAANIAKTYAYTYNVSNVSVLPYLSSFPLFALRKLCSYLLFANHIYASESK